MPYGGPAEATTSHARSSRQQHWSPRLCHLDWTGSLTGTTTSALCSVRLAKSWPLSLHAASRPLEQMCWTKPAGQSASSKPSRKTPSSNYVTTLVRPRIQHSRFRPPAPSAFSSPTGFLLFSLWLSEEKLASSRRLLDLLSAHSMGSQASLRTTLPRLRRLPTRILHLLPTA